MLTSNEIHLDSWSHGKVLVNMIYFQLDGMGGTILLERIRGPKPSYKSVRWGVEDSLNVIGAMLEAVLHPPTSTMPNTVPIAKVATRFNTMSVDWIPYDFEREYALRLQQESGRSVAIELEDAPCFAAWVFHTIQNAEAEGLFSIPRDQTH